jgi:hypothetical protein
VKPESWKLPDIQGGSTDAFSRKRPWRLFLELSW